MAASYDLEVADVGTFTFRRRTTRLQVGIEAETNRILGAPASSISDPALIRVAVALAELALLTAASPANWTDPTEVDPFDKDAVARVFLVHGRMMEAEATFRGGAKA